MGARWGEVRHQQAAEHAADTTARQSFLNPAATDRRHARQVKRQQHGQKQEQRREAAGAAERDAQSAPEEAPAAQDPQRDRRKIASAPDGRKDAGGQRHPDLADQVLNGLRMKGLFEQDRIAWRVGQQREAEEQGHGDEYHPRHLMAGPCRSAFPRTSSGHCGGGYHIKGARSMIPLSVVSEKYKGLPSREGSPSRRLGRLSSLLLVAYVYGPADLLERLSGDAILRG